MENQEQSTINQNEEELEKVESELSAVNAELANDISEARKMYIDNMQAMINLLKERHTKSLEATDGKDEVANNELYAISLVETPDPVVLFAVNKGGLRLDSMNRFDHNKMRSFFRRNKITKLKYPELVALIKQIPDPEHKAKMTCMFNSIVLFATESNAAGKPKNLATMVRLNFAIMRGAIKLGLMPVLASKAYEAFKKV